jgi:alkanesulfonate monooxygenase SsuD/methylene tetrahydromethanopterin reductase-like flavin-dependent oxidoreductase (luciferase family)
MDVGIGLPTTIPGVRGEEVLAWARRADEAGFSSLGTIDRVAYPNFESLVALAAAAAVTERVRLLTDILIAPLRTNTALLAKQAATIQKLSGGRLDLGLAVGGRPDDFEVSGADFGARGRTFERQLGELLAAWRGELGVGPALDGDRPGVLIGGSSDVAYRRAARYGDGWTMGGGTPDMFAEGRAKLLDAWREEGRDGEPRTMVLWYFALGDGAAEHARAYLGDYYAFLGEYVDQIIASAATDEETVRQYLAAFEQAGADEVICFPCSTGAEQVDLLAAARD